MRKLIAFMHTSLDGFVAGRNGEMDWIKTSDEMFEYAGKMTKKSDLALYGRVTFDMMEAYWPTAADKPEATSHDKEHSKWYKKVQKVVLSRTLQSDRKDIMVFSENIKQHILTLKNSKGKNIVIFGSPGAVHSLMYEDLIDDYWLFINPILLGDGIPMFRHITTITRLTLKKTKTLKDGVVCLHYKREEVE